jgi:hypothetical protein
MSALSQLPEIQNQKVCPFEKRPRCRKCDARSYSLLAVLMFRVITQFGMKHCTGGKEPTEDVEMPIPFLKMKRDNNCAGLNTEHLHRICGNCGYEWLSEVYS